MWIVSRGGLITAVEVLVRHRSVEGGLHTKGRKGRQRRRSKIGQCKYVTQLQYSQSTGLIYNHSSNWQRWLAGGRTGSVASSLCGSLISHSFSRTCPPLAINLISHIRDRNRFSFLLPEFPFFSHL